MGTFVHCLLALQLGLADPVLLPPAEWQQTSRDELLVGLPAVERRGFALLHLLRSMTLNDEESRRVAANITRLGDDDFHVRDRATQELLKEKTGAVLLLRKAATDNDLERKCRAELCLAALDGRHDAGRTEAALRLLALRRPAGARAGLLAFLPFAAQDDAVFDQTLCTLLELGPLTSADSQTCEQALESPAPLTRGGAALVLGYLGDVHQQTLAGKLLGDADAQVRLLTAMGLACRSNRAALEVLVHLLNRPAPIGWRAERLLTRLAGDSQTVAGAAAWRTWLVERDPRATVARIDLAQELGPTHRAQALARRFVETMIDPLRRDREVGKLTGIPFLISGVALLRTRQDFERAFLGSSFQRQQSSSRPTLESLYVMRGEEYAVETPADEQVFLDAIGLAHLRAVLMEANDSGRKDRGVLLLRVHENQEHVVGFGRSDK